MGGGRPAAGPARTISCATPTSPSPGTFKDRVLLEGDPFAVIEAMTIAAYATNCAHGYIYLRGEYPRAHHVLDHALEEARRRGYLGRDILGEGLDFDIEVRKGAGAYICGEETAIFNSIEGERGEPRNKPPFPVVSGLFAKPTVVNNVETLVNVLDVVLASGPVYAQTGTEASTGTKLFCVSGHVERPGVYEVPFGATLADVLGLAGGVAGGRALQCVLLGGAAGSFVGPEELDIPLTFEGARAAGTTLGSGVVLVFDETVDLPQMLMRIAGFFRDESCGQCVPCRVGTVRQEEALARLVAGRPLRWARARAAPDRRGGAVHARRVDLRARPDGLERRRVGDPPARRLPGRGGMSDLLDAEADGRARGRRRRRCASSRARRSSTPAVSWASRRRRSATARRCNPRTSAACASSRSRAPACSRPPVRARSRRG